MSKITAATTETAIRLITEMGTPNPEGAWTFIRHEWRTWDLVAIVEGAARGDGHATGCLSRMAGYYKPFGEYLEEIENAG